MRHPSGAKPQEPEKGSKISTLRRRHWGTGGDALLTSACHIADVTQAPVQPPTGAGEARRIHGEGGGGKGWIRGETSALNLLPDLTLGQVYPPAPEQYRPNRRE